MKILYKASVGMSKYDTRLDFECQKNEKQKAKNEKRKTKSEKRITNRIMKNEKQKTNNKKTKIKYEKPKAKNEKRKTNQLYLALQNEFGRLGLIQIMHSPKVIRV